MNLLTIILFWVIGCIALVILNAKFWKIAPDWEDREAQDAKARNTTPCVPQTPIPMKHKISYIIDWIIVVVVLALLFSCSKDLHNGRSYVIEEVKGTGYVIKLKGIDELFTIPVNTHKVGDTIKVWVTYKENKATIY